MGVKDRLAHAWNAFLNPDYDAINRSYSDYSGYANRPDRGRFNVTNEQSIISSIYTRVALDVAAIDIRHVRVDASDRYKEDVKSELNECFKTQANLDQAPLSFKQDIVMTLFDKGCAAIVPIDTTLNPNVTGGYDINTMRVGEIVAWFPNHVRVSVYNERVGRREEITLEKKFVAIVENPFYAIMNERNSTLQRLIRKLALLDVVDEQSSSGKLDLIIQLPYVVKSEARRKQAEQRRTEIEFQLKSSKYGIAYADGTEKITQLNRPAENNLLKTVEYLTNMLYGQLGLTPEIMNGTANEEAMLHYYNSTVEPIIQAIVEAMRRTFLTKTARTQGQSIAYFRDPFKLVPIGKIADIADKLVRNTVAAPNDIRVVIGWKPSSEPEANKLQNPNMPAPPSETASQPPIPEAGGNSQNDSS